MKRLLPLVLLLALAGQAHAFDVKGGSLGIFSTILCSAANFLNIDSGTLVVDCANNRVGVGTSSPQTPLHLNAGPLRIDTGCFDFQSGELKYAHDCSSYNSFTAAAAGGWTDDGTVVRLTAGTDSVGIGTTSPLNKLHTLGPNGSASLTASNGIMSYYSITDHTGIEFGADLNSPYAVWMQGKDYDNDNTSFPITLNPVGGNVGIGTDAPLDKLDVKGATDKHLLVGAASGRGVLLQSVNTANNDYEPVKLIAEGYEFNTGATTFGSSVTVNGSMGLYSRTKAQLLAITPSLRDMYWCSDCADPTSGKPTVVIATGTSAGNFGTLPVGAFQ